ncbi:MAG: hypothetical protein GY906_09160, partial [bacterium]|nr:hypothetical protein [bacterium]
DLIWLFITGISLYLLAGFFKYGGSRLRFCRFPFLIGQSLDVGLTRVRLDQPKFLKVTLRCVEEAHETHGSGEGRRSVVVCYAVYEQTITFTGSEIASNGEHRMTFTIPPDGLPTRLSNRPPRYWEIEIHADTPGIDYHGTFLVPVYEA